METLRLLKLQLAMALLGRTSLAIKEIANRCGFESPLISRLASRGYLAPQRKRCSRCSKKKRLLRTRQ